MVGSGQSEPAMCENIVMSTQLNLIMNSAVYFGGGLAKVAGELGWPTCLWSTLYQNACLHRWFSGQVNGQQVGSKLNESTQSLAFSREAYTMAPTSVRCESSCPAT